MNNITNPWRRVLAYLIDLVISWLIILALVYWFSGSSDLVMALDRLSIFVISVIFIIPILYPVINSFLISRFGVTIGKFLTGTKIVSEKNKNISFWRAFLRNHIGYMVSGSFVGLGFIWVFIDKEKRAWHDMVADTFVVTTNRGFIIVGILILIGLMFADFSLIMSSFNNFKSNSNVYVDLVNTIKTSLETSSTSH